MTKAEIVQALYSRVGGFSKKESADMVDLVFEMMKETLGKGEKIKVSGFGNFVLRDKRQRPGRNPQTGEPIKISERRVLTFKASQILKLALNHRLLSQNGNGAALGAASDRHGDHGFHRSLWPGGCARPAPCADHARSALRAGERHHVLHPARRLVRLGVCDNFVAGVHCAAAFCVVRA